ncbi:cohesin loading factor [Calycina marina]|uniref:Cohesin loading factor n=1 Tax=Calycina marina TaxID=1763456 RepID=A0A9P7Z4Y6_9HELO|nr:cohesin loading factor [Calycina marina]
MASRRPAAPVEIDRSKLAVALAEEYFDAAHKIAPAASMSMPAKALEEYHKLIAAGLGLLEATLRRGGMTPREEANMRLRYCSVLFEETENSMEAETALSQGITICERNHYFDLKYALQFLLAQIMFKKNPKAGLRALDAHIADAEAYQHIPWVYAFRFLRASLSLASPVPADKWKGNFEKITTLATQQNDYGIRLASCLMEALAYLKYGGPDSIEAVQGAIAAAWSYQAQPSCQIPQLIALLHMIDTTCSIRQGSPEVMMTKLRAMQRMIDAALADEESWGFTDDSIAIPMSRSAHSSQVVSSDTRSVLGIGRDGGDKLMMSFLHKRDAYAITYLLGSLVLFNKDAETGKAAKYLYSGLETIGSAKKKDMPMYDTLPNCVSRNQWRSQIACYYTSCLAFIAAAKCEWTAVKIQVEKLNSAMKDLGDGNVGPLNSVALYLSGIYHQGTGDLDAALPIFQDKVFDLSIYENVTSSAAQLQKDYALLAAFNTILICQEPGRKDPQRNNKLVGKMTEACLNHQSPDVRTASKILSVTVLRSPPMSSIDVRGHLSMALKGAKISGNLHFTSLALSIMCSRFFVDVVGLQAEKSALAASAQAHRSHNALWISVADGMLGNVHELNGNSGEAHRALARARQYADAAFPHP